MGLGVSQSTLAEGALGEEVPEPARGAGSVTWGWFQVAEASARGGRAKRTPGGQAPEMRMGDWACVV